VELFKKKDSQFWRFDFKMGEQALPWIDQGKQQQEI